MLSVVSVDGSCVPHLHVQPPPPSPPPPAADPVPQLEQSAQDAQTQYARDLQMAGLPWGGLPMDPNQSPEQLGLTDGKGGAGWRTLVSSNGALPLSPGQIQQLQSDWQSVQSTKSAVAAAKPQYGYVTAPASPPSPPPRQIRSRPCKRTLIRSKRSTRRICSRWRGRSGASLRWIRPSRPSNWG